MAMQELGSKLGIRMRRRLSAWTRTRWGTVLYRRPKRRFLKTFFIQWNYRKFGRYHFERMSKARLAVLMLSAIMAGLLLSVESSVAHSLYGFVPLMSLAVPKDFGAIWDLWTDPITIDGSASNRCGTSSSCATSLTTSSSPDVVYVSFDIGSGGIPSASCSSTHLTFTQRAAYLPSGGISMVTFYAVASSTLSSESITCSISSSHNLVVMAWGISGANTSTIFDSNASLPATNGADGTDTSGSVTISTSNANNFLIGSIGIAGSKCTPTGTSGFTWIGTCQNAPTGYSEYEIVSSTQSGLNVGFSWSGGAAFAMIADAVMQYSAAPSHFQALFHDVF